MFILGKCCHLSWGGGGCSCTGGKSPNEILLGVDSTSDRTGRLVLCFRVHLLSFHR